MLLELAVADLALLERVRVRLGPGLTVITGETGAGKSLLIDALLLVLGGRADPALVRTGAEQARVEAVFETREGVTIAVRELSAGGRSLARLDDETVTAGRLAATVSPLVEIHGQHDQQRLLAAAAQRDLLDAYGGLGAERAAVAEAVAAVRQNAARLAELAIDPAEVERRRDLATHAAEEIEAAAIRPGEIEELRARVAAIASGERIVRVAEAALERIAGDGGLRDLMGATRADLAELARIDDRMAELADRAAGLEAESEELAADLRRAVQDAELDAPLRASLEERLGLLYGLLRKHGESEEAVIAAGIAAREEADRLGGSAAERARREADGARLLATAAAAAAGLGAGRRAAAARLGPTVTELLRELGFPDGAFDVAVETIPLEAAGTEGVVFRLAPNPGEAARPLARIASGGELSRVALAIKQVVAAADATGTLVFDEVDTGIGGRSAEPLGRALWTLGQRHQVLCVTHLPQIAAWADAHLRIEKRTEAGRTATTVTVLDAEARVAELAAMLSGDAGGDAARATARGLLARARERRATG